jgi:hypothetical protein
MKKPEILNEIESLSSKWVVMFIIDLKDPNELMEEIGLKQVAELLNHSWMNICDDSKNFFIEILDVLTNCWGHDEIEGAEMVCDVKRALLAFNEAIKSFSDKQREDYGGFFRSERVHAMISAAEKIGCDTVRLQMTWGW